MLGTWFRETSRECKASSKVMRIKSSHASVTIRMETLSSSSNSICHDNIHNLASCETKSNIITVGSLEYKAKNNLKEVQEGEESKI